MSLGFMPDSVTPFNYPEELIQKGLKPRHLFSADDGKKEDEEEEKKENHKERGSKWNRLWLVCKKISGVVGKHDNGVFLSDDVEIRVDAR